MEISICRTWVGLLGMLAAPSVWGQQQPNVVIILADDMGYGDVQCNNPYARTLTPAIDRLAGEGIRFTEAHSAGALSGPSRYGLVTGRYFFREPKKEEYWGYLPAYMNKDRMTIGSMMQQAGYTTACIGKWHLGLDWQLKDKRKPLVLNQQRFDYTNTDFSQPVGGSPTSCGFDYSFILPASLDMPPYVFVRNDKVVDPDVVLTADVYPQQKADTQFAWDKQYIRENDIYWERGVWWRNGEMSRSFKVEDCLTTVIDEGLSFIDREGRKKDRPFFLYLPLTGPHTPWMATPDSKGKTQLGTYGDFICDIDQAVQQVDDKLEELGIRENTIVIFASDNGAAWETEDVEKYAHQANWGRKGMKGDAWDGGHHVPLIVRWPDHIKSGSVSNSTVGLIDLLATLADITGQQLPKGQAEDSFSFRSVLEGDLNAETRDHIIYLSGAGKLAIKKGAWKYIECLGSAGFTKPYVVDPVKNGPKAQLYHIESDQQETTNRIMQHPEIADELDRLLHRYVKQGHTRRM